MAEVAVVGLQTPKRERRSIPPERNQERRKSLFGVCGVSPLSSCSSESYSPPIPSPSWSESPLKSPAKTPLKTPLRSLENDFNHLLLDRTPSRSDSRLICHRVRRSPRVAGIRALSPDHGLIRPGLFYGKMESPSRLFQKIRDRVRIRLPMENFTEPKKRARSSESYSMRPKKIPRYRLFNEDDMKKIEKLDTKIAKMNKKKETIKIDRDEAKKNSIKKKREKKSYNWEIFSSQSPGQTKKRKSYTKASPSLNTSSTLLTPPATEKKRKLMAIKDLDHIDVSEDVAEDTTKETAEQNNTVSVEGDLAQAIVNDFREEEMEEVVPTKKIEDILEELNKEVKEMLGDEVTEVPGNSEKTNAELVNPLENIEKCKYFPIFFPDHDSLTRTPPSLFSSPADKKAKRLKTDDNQLLLDAGQKSLREVECSTCDLLYINGDSQDELEHKKHHDLYKGLKFTGWKNMRIAGIIGFDKVILVRNGDPKHWWDKARCVLEVIDKELGFPQDSYNNLQVYMYVKDKKIVGCAVARPLQRAYRMLPNLGIEADVCSEECYPVKAGISRLWVQAQHRQQGVASSLVDAIRRNFVFGTILRIDDIALSSPTEDGKRFAIKYCKREDFLVYTFDI